MTEIPPSKEPSEDIFFKDTFAEIENLSRDAKQISSRGGLLKPSIAKFLIFIWKFTSDIDVKTASIVNHNQKTGLIADLLRLFQNNIPLSDIQLLSLKHIFHSISYTDLTSLYTKAKETQGIFTSFPKESKEVVNYIKGILNG